MKQTKIDKMVEDQVFNEIDDDCETWQQVRFKFLFIGFCLGVACMATFCVILKYGKL